MNKPNPKEGSTYGGNKARVCSTCAHYGFKTGKRKMQLRCSLTGQKVLSIMKGCPMYASSLETARVRTKLYGVKLVEETIETCKERD